MEAKGDWISEQGRRLSSNYSSGLGAAAVWCVWCVWCVIEAIAILHDGMLRDAACPWSKDLSIARSPF